MSECPFCSVATGALPATIVWTSSDAVAFLDHRPVFKGHVLVAPVDHISTLGDLATHRLGPFFAVVQRIAIAVEVGLAAGGTFVAMNNKVSQSVPHLHVHVIPRTKGDGLRGFFWPRTRYAGPAEADDYATRIRSALDSGAP